MLPPRTEEESKGIALVEDYLDCEADYTKDGPFIIEDEEKCRLMNLGYHRIMQEWREEADSCA